MERRLAQVEQRPGRGEEHQILVHDLDADEVVGPLAVLYETVVPGAQRRPVIVAGVVQQPEPRLPCPVQVIAVQRQDRSGKVGLAGDHGGRCRVTAIERKEMEYGPATWLQCRVQPPVEREDVGRPDVLERADRIDLVVGLNAVVARDEVVEFGLEAKRAGNLSELVVRKRQT
jgi:hypothetical protein